MKIKIYSTSKHPLPQYATQQSAGLDLRANIDSSVTINPGERVLVPTGLHIQLPYGYEARIQPRSGLALKRVLLVSILQGAWTQTIEER